MRVNIRDVLFAIPYAERMAMLMCSVMDEHKTNPTAPVMHMVKATKILAQHLSVNDRIAVANAFRDAADQVENRHRRVAVN